MTWEDVAGYLRRDDMLIVPVGSIEQHGRHLPLGSDSIEAVELSLRVAERANVLVAPVVLAGVSDYHLGFPGTIALSPATFEAVLFDTKSLASHGFRRILFYSAHGGNAPYVASVVNRINRETRATAIDLARFDPPPKEPQLQKLKMDFHAGVEETSSARTGGPPPRPTSCRPLVSTRSTSPGSAGGAPRPTRSRDPGSPGEANR